MNALLIAGTEAGVGKTTLTMALAAYWQTFGGDRPNLAQHSHPLGIFKPVQCGGNDAAQYQRVLSLAQSLDEICPVTFPDGLDIPIASARTGERLCLEVIWRSLERLRQQREFVLMEGLGSLGTPLTSEMTVADLAWDWRLPTVLVVPVQPGAIAQAIAHVALAQQSRVHLKGIVLNCVQSCSEQELQAWANPGLLQSLTQTPVLGCIPHLSDPANLEQLAHAASDLVLERLLPLHALLESEKNYVNV